MGFMQMHNVASEDNTRQNWRDSGVSVPPPFGYKAPLFKGITGVNEHIEPVFNAALPSAVVMQRSLKGLTPFEAFTSGVLHLILGPCKIRFSPSIEPLQSVKNSAGIFS